MHLPAQDMELSEKEKLALELEASEEVAKEAKAEKRKAFKLAAKQRLKKQALFQAGKDDTGENLTSVLIQLPNFQDEIRLDGMRYINGRVYQVGPGKLAVLNDIMFRGEKHNAEIHGHKMSEFYGMRTRNPQTGSSHTISPNSPQPANNFEFR